MYLEAIEQLSCPQHPSARLALELGARYAPDGGVERGWLRCSVCASRYPIRAGVADLLGRGVRPATPAQLTNLLPPTAWAYERLWRHRALSLLSGEPFGYTRELPLIAGLGGADRPGLLVDVACSNGLYARALARAGAPGPIVGLDHAMPMLRQARAYARREGLRISYVRASAQALPCGDGAAAALVMGGSLNEIGDAPAALAELRRACAADGRITLMSLVRGTTPTGRLLQTLLGLGGIAFPPLDALNRLLAAAGLRLRAQWQHRVVVFSLLTPG